MLAKLGERELLASARMLPPMWIGRFYRADTSNFPPEDKNDEAAIAAMTEFFQEGLKGLKAKAEAK